MNNQKEQGRKIEDKHINKHLPCKACEHMYMDWIKRLEKQNEVLIEMLRMKELSKPMIFPVGTLIKGLDSECLHNGCNHERNPICNLYCPHCGPTC